MEAPSAQRVADTQTRRDQLLKTSKHFCMLPWVHLHMWPNSQVFPCCVADSFYPIGEYKDSLLEVWNSPQMRELRRNMLADQPSSKMCRRCYDQEKHEGVSMRQDSLTHFEKDFDSVLKTKPDGTVDEFKLRYLDVRFSNLCNMRCRSCGPHLSSAWAEDQRALHGEWPWKVIKIGETFWRDIKPHLGSVEMAYFAGGEPIICDELYQILDHWLEIDYTHVSLTYTTNFSVLQFKDKNVIDYWKKFPNTTVLASLDDSGTRAEFLRKGTQWKQVVENRRRMLREAPEVRFEITPTIGIYNIWHFPQFHREWLEEGLIPADGARLNLLSKPAHLSFTTIPKDMRAPLIELWENALSDLETWAAQKNVDIPTAREGYRLVLSALKNGEPEDTLESFWDYTQKLDQVRNEKALEVYPELKSLLV